MKYYDWMNSQQACPNCNWRGPGSQAETGDAFGDGAEYHCPECEHYFGFVGYPLVEEVLTDPRADARDKILVAAKTDLWSKYLATRITHETQLPELESESPLVFLWDFEAGAGNDRWTVIRAGEQVILKEESWFEYYERFIEVAKLLKLRYGGLILDLKPTEASWLDLFGDRLSAPSIIDRARQDIFGIAIRNP